MEPPDWWHAVLSLSADGAVVIVGAKLETLPAADEEAPMRGAVSQSPTDMPPTEEIEGV